ncbi:MAG: aspartyl protease family protein, partial [Gemmatimonadetes bacterium]|nr:aspartyl protease family protein [Gemmatimonadota bacterium]
MLRRPADRRFRLRPDRYRRGCHVAALPAALIFCACSAGSDESAAEGADSTDPVEVAALAEVPIDTDFGLVWLEVSVNGSDPLPFLLDTGFDYSVIDAGVAAALSLTVSDPDTVPQPGGPVEIGLAEGVTIRMPGGEF